MEPTRRRFLGRMAGAGASLALGGTLVGGRFVQQAYARSELSRQLIDQATPVLTEQAHHELRTIPEACREQIRIRFHEACLNVSSFVSTICSTDFQDRLAALADDSARERLFVLTFGQKVTPHAEIVRWVRTIAEETSAELRADWEDTCNQLAEKWTLTLSSFETGVSAEAFLQETDASIQAGIDEARRTAYPLAGQTQLLDTGTAPQAVEQAALLRINVREMQDSAPTFVPVFLWNALTDVYSFFTGSRYEDPAVYRHAISERLALLGNRVGSEFESEVRRRLSDLHEWQRKSVTVAAQRRAEELVPSFL